MGQSLIAATVSIIFEIHIIQTHNPMGLIRAQLSYITPINRKLIIVIIIPSTTVLFIIPNIGSIPRSKLNLAQIIYCNVQGTEQVIIYKLLVGLANPITHLVCFILIIKPIGNRQE